MLLVCVLCLYNIAVRRMSCFCYERRCNNQKTPSTNVTAPDQAASATHRSENRESVGWAVLLTHLLIAAGEARRPAPCLDTICLNTNAIMLRADRPKLQDPLLQAVFDPERVLWACAAKVGAEEEEGGKLCFG